MQWIRLDSGRAVDGLPFGVDEVALIDAIGAPDARRVNFDGEVELLFGVAIYRLQAGAFVECTHPEAGERPSALVVDGLPVLDLHGWLGGQPGTLDRARFRINPALGIACDRRDPAAPSFTLFVRGHWDGVLGLG